MTGEKVPTYGSRAVPAKRTETARADKRVAQQDRALAQKLDDAFGSALDQVEGSPEFAAYRERAEHLRRAVEGRRDSVVQGAARSVPKDAALREWEYTAHRRTRAARIWGPVTWISLAVMVVCFVLWMNVAVPAPGWAVAFGLITMAALLSALFAAVSWLITGVRRANAKRRRDVLGAQWWARVWTWMLAEVSALYSLAVRDQSTPEVHAEFPRKAPRLVELNTDKIVPRPPIRRATRFVFEHQTSAIGITGPRGVGKSTLLRSLESSVKNGEETGVKPGTAVIVEAPVRYDPDDLLRMIALKLNEQRPPARRSRRDGGASTSPARAWRMGIAVAVVLIVIGATLVVFDMAMRIDVFAENPMSVAGAVALLTGIAVLGWILWLRLARGRTVISQADAGWVALEDLVNEFEFEFDERSTVSAGVKGAAEVSASTARGRTTRALTHARLVARLQGALATIRESTQAPVLIAIDELDKLPSRDALLATVNGLKDILHIKGVHVAVTLSDEALNAFELRETAERDAFDSTFDEIIDVDRLDALSVHDVVDSRVSGFPPGLTDACYVWSAGLTRDLVRHLRACIEHVDVSYADVPAPPWHQIALEVSEKDLRQKLAVAQRSGSRPESVERLANLNHTWATRPPVADDLPRDGELDERAERLAAYAVTRYAAAWFIAQGRCVGSERADRLDRLRDVVVAASSDDGLAIAREQLGELVEAGLIVAASSTAPAMPNDTEDQSSGAAD